MIHTIDGWQVEDFDGQYGRVVDYATTKATGRGAIENSGFTLPGRRRTRALVHQPAPSAYTLSVTCVGPDYVSARDMVAELHRRLPVSRTVALGRSDAGLEVFADAFVFSATDVDGLDMGNGTLRATFVFEVLVWLDSAEASAAVPSGTNLIPALSGGSAPMECTFTITGNGSNTNVEITDAESGAWWRLVGNVTPGHVVTVDPLAHTAKVGATDYSTLLTVGDRPFYLDPSAVLTQARNGSGETRVTARRGWFE